MSDLNFYRAFEERYRGSREVIKSRLEVYLPFILPLKQFDETCQGIDLGCGRGEWLELMHEYGINVQGVDLDDLMLEACRERSLKASSVDAIEALKALPNNSQLVVTGFHIAEHLQFSALQTLMIEAFRVLKPGGLLILETPNPENIGVATVNFYLDPTHQRPLPPLLLTFLSEHCGFTQVKLIRLQEYKALLDSPWVSITDILEGVSPDYAVIAQKYAGGSLLSLNSEAFTKEYGIKPDELARKFDQQAWQTNERISLAEAHARQTDLIINNILHSKSWRYTAPFRAIYRFFSSKPRQ